ncbi:uncharacterized protein GGS22DRAFT_181772 [Annulohypoxylon maeteangense]|uniref:uncharacterized protein n=1 Tax=Annulohypoxylon maeteangense TaxID=1927788 RepID=UPI00200726FD|nr:uncharacterized protein GGS22DRAFT_181772 [Annulohypoxylon maeteangense]KAI0881240.1 hypothetical protein GGS22DRAFT_181772 [Annulohypoxylon maeteangense]
MPDSLDLSKLRLSGNRVQAASTASTKSVAQFQKMKRDITSAKMATPPRSTAGSFKKACSVDLLFLIDTTGSMSPYIKAAREQVKDIVARVKENFLNESVIRVAIVGYKDHADNPNIQFLDFTPDTAKANMFLDMLVVMNGGGGDLPEDVLGGIQQAINASWLQESRCIIHITDAPPHGRNLHDMMSIRCDDYLEPGSEPHRLTYEPLLNRLVRLNVNYALLRINEDTDLMASAFSAVYKTAHAEVKLHKANRYNADSQASKAFGAYAKNSVTVALKFEELQLGMTFDLLKHLVVKSVSSSISRTASRLSSERSTTIGRGVGTTVHLPAINEEKTEEVLVENVSPQWNTPGWLDKRLIVEGLCPDLAEHRADKFNDMMALDDQIGTSFIKLVIDARSTPFSQGGLRTTAYARTPVSTDHFVVKSLKEKSHEFAKLAEHMECQAMCKEFAVEFNALLDPKYSIDFVISTALTSKASVGIESECISLEPHINGPYVKYNDPYTYVNPNENPSNDAAQAFSHFTFERSFGRILINDLQGVGNLLTDPAIHTKDRNRFKLGDTNRHEDGFKFFMSGGILMFRANWPNVIGMVYCSNKLCRRILHKATAGKWDKHPGYYWCHSCWPQLNSGIVRLRCSEPGPMHEHVVSKFFYESQGESMPTKCPQHLIRSATPASDGILPGLFL